MLTTYMVWPREHPAPLYGVKIYSKSASLAAEFGCCCLNDAKKMSMADGDTAVMYVLNSRTRPKQQWKVEVRRKSKHRYVAELVTRIKVGYV